MKNKKYLKKNIILAIALVFILAAGFFSRLWGVSFLSVRDALAQSNAGTAIAWNRWEKSLTSTKTYANPYTDVRVAVTYTGPSG